MHTKLVVMSEEPKHKCKICQEEKHKTFVGYSSSFSGIYKDDRGRQWLGKVCPDCIKVMFRIRRADKKKKQQEAEAKAKSSGSAES